ncbi:branched-chain amino acid ABC transporter permease [Streptomyces chilikensis]|uniref:branched-chain amino acid ABC transporter permease n=1 Tax=Streptomyces chilikensis TaxID=1194079 RepID=UPI000A9E078D|nr:branched-chain amino acid ABC transporter permease [Streptomyces chilikensis]
MPTTTEAGEKDPAAAADGRGGPRRRWRSSVLPRHLSLAVLGLLAVTVVMETTGSFANSQLASMAYLGIAAGGLTVLTGLNGQLSLGHGAFMAVGAYTTALFLDGEPPALPLPVVLAAATLVTLLVGAVVGVAAARLHGPYIAGATLALAVAVPGVVLHFERLGGEQGLGVRMPETPVWVLDAAYFVTGSELDPTKYVAYIGWAALVVTYVLLANLMRGRVGRTWRAVRDDEVAAEIAGIHLGRARVLAFVVSTACAGLAGAVMAMAVRITAPSGFSLTLSLTLLSAVVLGGLGSLTGALIGSALLTFLPHLVTGLGTDAGLTDVRAAELAPAVYGLTMILVILVAPAGITGTLRNLWRRRRGVA